MSFNAYGFIDEVVADLKTECSDLTNEVSVREYILQEIDTACIYTWNCFEIVRELGISDWSDLISEFGEITSIEDVAYYGLRNYCDSNIDVDGIVREALEKEERIEEIKDQIEELEEEMEALKQDIEDIQNEDDYTGDEDQDEQDRLKEIEHELTELKQELIEWEE